MKIGSRVRLAPNKDGIIRKRYGHLRGVVVGLNGAYADVRFENGGVDTHRVSALILVEEEPFPYRSHRTMAEVIADEQKPVPA